MHNRAKTIAIICASVTLLAALAVVVLVIATQHLDEPDWWPEAPSTEPIQEPATRENQTHWHKIRARFTADDRQDVTARIKERIHRSDREWEYHALFHRHGLQIRTTDQELVADLRELDHQGERLTQGYREWDTARASNATDQDVQPGHHRVTLVIKGVHPHPNMRRAILALVIVAGPALVATPFACNQYLISTALTAPETRTERARPH